MHLVLDLQLCDAESVAERDLPGGDLTPASRRYERL